MKEKQEKKITEKIRALGKRENVGKENIKKLTPMLKLKGRAFLNVVTSMMD